MVLGGSVTRPAYAADLYAAGYAPEVWVGRVRRTEVEALLAGLGIPLPAQHELYLKVLSSKGVPAGKVRCYGQDLNSTLEEAAAFAAAFPPRGKRVLVVTSRPHARRARLVFRRRLPGAAVLVAATPYESFTRAWWRRKDLALGSVGEALKTVYYLAGASFEKDPCAPAKGRAAAPPGPSRDLTYLK